MITNRTKELVVRLIADGHDTKQAIAALGIDEGIIDALSSPACSDRIAHKEGQRLVLSREGADLLHELQKEDEMKRISSASVFWAKCAAVIGILAIAVSIVLALLSN